MELHKDDTRAILEKLGFEVNKAYKFKMRPDEHTPSASINPRNGKIKDFGSGFSGDIIAFYKEITDCSDKEAFKVVGQIAAELGVDLNHKNLQSRYSSTEFSKISSNSFANEELPPISQAIIDNFQNERKENFKRFSELLAMTLPTCDSQKRKDIAIKFEIGYSKKADRLIMPIRDENGDCRTLWKYNPSPAPFIADNGEIIQLSKYRFTAKRPRKNEIFNYKDLKEVFLKDKEQPIFFAEGEKDCLNMVANDLRAISLGSAAARISDKLLPLFKDTNVVICYDYDEAGKNGAKQLSEQLKSVCKTIEIIDWEKVVKKVGLTNNLFNKFDFTDYLMALKKRQEIKRELNDEVQR